MPECPRYCGYCGRLARRCQCAERARKFFACGGRDYAPSFRDTPYKHAAPPQVKRRERATLRANYAAWYQHLAERDGERCLNCGARSDLALDHILPIAKGGLSKIENLQLLCAPCNQRKGKLVIDCRGDGVQTHL